ncbi:MAG TPA: arginine--tRNA ligase [Candidatus Paceibacterota bacterium]
MKEKIEKAIANALISLGAGEARFVVERPRAMAHGDYATNAALVAKVDPQELSSSLRSLLSSDEIEKIEVVGKFVNFCLSRQALVPQPQAIPQLYSGKQILVEYTSPNLFKPLHIGNLIGNILGESVARLLEATGAEVKRLNYPSDIGLTVAKGVWGLLKTQGDPSDIKALGAAYVAGNAAYEDGSAKQEIDEINTALYEGTNAQWSGLRQKGIETSRRHLDELCARLGTKFDREFFESESGPLGRDAVKEHIGGVFKESEGAVVYEGAHTRVFLNSRGLPTYEAKEVGLFDLKSKAYPAFDISITVTGNEQREFFAVVFDAIQKMFPERTAHRSLRHIANGFLKLTTGKMSSRLGNVITGESLLEDLTEKARGQEAVAVGAIKYAVLKSGSGKDIIFDPEQSLSLEGDSGPYLQYALVRARSLAKAAGGTGIHPGQEDMPQEGSVLERLLIHNSEVIERAAREMEPHHVTTYLTEVASAFNSWYASGRVIGGAAPHYGVWLTYATIKILKEGLDILGIPAPEEM